MYGIIFYLLNDFVVILKLNFRFNFFFVIIKMVGVMDKELYVFRVFFYMLYFLKG